MILIVTNKTDYTVDYVILELKRRGIEFARFNTEDYPADIDLTIDISAGGVDGVLSLPDKTICLHQIHSIWYRRPVYHVPSHILSDPAAQEFALIELRETLDGLWRILPCFWVSHPDRLRVAESKIYQLQLANSLGLITPPTRITDNPDTARDFYRRYAKSVIYKPQRHSKIVRGESVSLIYTTKLDNIEPEHFDQVAYAPVLLQPYIHKHLEIRATVVGRQIFAVELHTQDVVDAQEDWRRADIRNIKHEPHQLPADIKQKCLSLVNTLNLQFGAIDLILTPEQEYVFLEINPNGQWAWIEQMCPNILIREALIDLLEEG